MILKQHQFKRIEEYKKVFKVTEGTIFAYDGNIYANSPLPQHLIIHETVHLERQKEMGADKWVDKYLTDKEFRLNEEILAYREQLKSIKNRDERAKLLIKCSQDLSSPLYGNIVTFFEALKLLRV